MKLPAPIQFYFDADQTTGGPAPLSAFAPDAIVKDEGKTHVGHRAIGTWWLAAKAQHQHRAEPLEFSQTHGLAAVRAEVSGKFAGSPAVLTFKFKLAGCRIAALEIGA